MAVAGVDLAAAVDYNLDSEDYAVGVLANYAMSDKLSEAELLLTLTF